MTNSDTHKKAMVEALKAALGIVKTACESVGISRQTHYRWLVEDEQYKQDVEDIAEDAIDFAESKLQDQIKKGDTTATIFYLKTKGKKRGFVEKVEQDVRYPDGVQLVFEKAPVIPYETK